MKIAIVLLGAAGLAAAAPKASLIKKILYLFSLLDFQFSYIENVENQENL